MEATNFSDTIIIRTSLVNGQVVLSVYDTGHGISKDILDDLGTPFVTTKDTGIGLGLPICYNIAERNKAIIHVKTSKTCTNFDIFFLEVPSTECCSVAAEA